MSSKTEEYLALAQRTANGLTRYWESWTDYLTTASGAELLMHIVIDTVKLGGKEASEWMKHKSNKLLSDSPFMELRFWTRAAKFFS